MAKPLPISHFFVQLYLVCLSIKPIISLGTRKRFKMAAKIFWKKSPWNINVFEESDPYNYSISILTYAYLSTRLFNFPSNRVPVLVSFQAGARSMKIGIPTFDSTSRILRTVGSQTSSFLNQRRTPLSAINRLLQDGSTSPHHAGSAVHIALIPWLPYRYQAVDHWNSNRRTQCDSHRYSRLLR